MDRNLNTPTWNYRSTGPLAILGRGRGMSLLIMGAVALFSYLSNPHYWEQELSQNNMMVATAVRNEQSQVPFDVETLVARHGGVVEDHRTQQLRQVGNPLASAVGHVPAGTVRFYLLRDEENPFSVATQDGVILMTAAQFSQIKSQGQLAAELSQRITEFVYPGYNPSEHPEVSQYRDQLMAAVGYRQSDAVLTTPLVARSSNQSVR